MNTTEGIIWLAVVFIAFITVYLFFPALNQLRFNRIKKLYNYDGPNEYDRDLIETDLMETGILNNFNFNVSDFFLGIISGHHFPIIFGETTYILTHWTGNRPSTTKAYFLVANNNDKRDLIIRLPKIFTSACKSEHLEIFWIKDMRALSSILVGNKNVNQKGK